MNLSMVRLDGLGFAKHNLATKQENSVIINTKFDLKKNIMIVKNKSLHEWH